MPSGVLAEDCTADCAVSANLYIESVNELESIRPTENSPIYTGD